MAKSASVTLDALLDKGDGSLVKRGTVWTYPDAPLDMSGTNLRLPIESVSDAVVQDAIVKGDLVARVNDGTGVPVAVARKSDEDVPVRIVNLMTAGTVELATELPLNSRPTHDAGRRPGEVSAAIAQGKVDPKEPKPSGPIAPAVPIATAPAAVPKA